jgi:hypothetical protein
MMSMNPDQFLSKIWVGTSKGAKISQSICEENTQQGVFSSIVESTKSEHHI